jgi:hypothetical protein
VHVCASISTCRLLPRDGEHVLDWGLVLFVVAGILQITPASLPFPVALLGAVRAPKRFTCTLGGSTVTWYSPATLADLVALQAQVIRVPSSTPHTVRICCTARIACEARLAPFGRLIGVGSAATSMPSVKHHATAFVLAVHSRSAIENLTTLLEERHRNASQPRTC